MSKLCVGPFKFDGALRRNHSAAAGMAMWVVDPKTGLQDLLFRGGKILGTLQSSLAAELLALEWTLDLLYQILSSVVAGR